jgi:hypothetical protein
MELLFQSGDAQFKISEFRHRPYYHRDGEGLKTDTMQKDAAYC